MSKLNPLGLVGYGDSDDDSGDEKCIMSSLQNPALHDMASANSGILPAPIPHCPWSACYDESSGCTYYWNQQTNAVTWEAPPEYLLALKLAQQHLQSSGSAEVSAEEWQLYQQALADKQMQKLISKPPITTRPSLTKLVEKNVVSSNDKSSNSGVKRPNSDDEDVKIELITSYSNTDSDSNDEIDSPIKVNSVPKKPVEVPKNKKNTVKVQSKMKHLYKKQKTKTAEYGPSLPENQNYTVPIGPELPPHLVNQVEPQIKPQVLQRVEPQIEIQTEPLAEPKTEPQPQAEPQAKLQAEPHTEAIKSETNTSDNDGDKKSSIADSEEMQDEMTLLEKLKNKADLLKKLGGEIPEELQTIIEEETARIVSAKEVKPIDSNKPSIDTNIDDLLDEIEKKELPKAKTKIPIDMFVENDSKTSPINSIINSPRSAGDMTPPIEDFKPLFPSGKSDEESTKCIFSSVKKIEVNGVENEDNKEIITPAATFEKKPTNVYLMDPSEVADKVTKKKRRIDNSVLPERKTVDTPAYTTKYSQNIEGFSSEHTGLGFSKGEEQVDETPKATINYGNGLMFTKGEILNEDKKDEALDDLTDLVEAKLLFLCQQQLTPITPVQEMLIQLQTLASAFRAGALTSSYWRRWTEAAAVALAQHEASAPPHGWTCVFIRSEGRYRYRRDADGLEQWEYPAIATTDMDICTTPPPPDVPAAPKEELAPPPIPPSPAVRARARAPPLPPTAAPPAPATASPPCPPEPPTWDRVCTPPPPAWNDPPPPGCDDAPSLPLPPPPPPEPKKEIGDELLSFYNDIAELEKVTVPAPSSSIVSQTSSFVSKTASNHSTAPNSPEPPPPEHIDKKKETTKISKKKSKVKISSSMGMKHKTVSSMVAKWQQVADEINSD